MLYLPGIFIAFFLAIILFTKKDKTSSDKILALWLFLIGVHLLLFYLKFSEKIYELPFLLGLDLPLPLIHPPFLYWYTASLCGARQAQSKWIGLHFLPAVLCYLYLIDFYFLPSGQKIWVYQNRGAGYEPFLFVKLSATIVSGICYVVLSGLLLRRHTKNIHDLFSYEEKINLRWLQYLIGGIAVIWLVIFTRSDPAVFGAVVLFVLFIGFFGIRQVGIFTNTPSFQPTPPGGDPPRQTAGPDVETFPEPEVPAAESATDDEPSPAHDRDQRKYLKSGLTAESAENLHRALKNLMETQKVYCESELSLTNLAQRLGIHPNYLSQVINEKEGKNFFDYVNTLRVAEFMKLAADPKNRRFTILALAFDCGFNSKSSFIRYFKKATGHAPSAYLQHSHG